MKLVVLLRILCLVLLVFFFQNHKVSGQCRDHEQEALLELKTGFLNFSPHSSIGTWRRYIDCCKWEGIVCDNDTGKVVSLDINNSSIEGDEISSRIFALGDLEVLNLAYNQFHGSIPSRLDRFSKLTHLNLSNSGFTGQIPLEISTMTQLVSLDLSSHSFAPLKLENPDLSTLIKDLINLRQLHLGGVNISSIIISLNKLSSLESLNLRACYLLGDFPVEVFLFKNLTDLDISYNPDLKVVIPEFPKNSILRSLKLPWTNLSSISAASLSKLYFLTTLDVSLCHISGYLPYWTSTLINLVYLDMSSNDFVGDIHSLQNLTNLVHLDLSLNSFTGNILSLQNLTKLVHLDLSYNSFMNGLRHLKKSSKLSYLDLKKNNFNEDSSTFMRELENHINLTHLDLSHNKFTGKISFMDKLTRLNTLDISNNSFSGSIPKMENHQDLLEIDMSKNNFSGSMPSFSSSKNLKMIDLSSNRLQGQIPRYANLSNLYSLEASNNLLEGPIPFSLFYHPSVRNLILNNNSFSNITEEESINTTTSKLLYLEMSSNNLKGPIPSFLFQHPSMKYLDLSRNNLHYIIEDENINMTSSKIGELDLKSNHLKQIPKWIFQLKNLGYLNLEDNNFSGAFYHSENNLFVINTSSNSTLPFFPELQYVYMSNCKLNEFPSFLRRIRSLYELDLSKNNISGKIPNWIWNAFDSSYSQVLLNLSYNLLEGFEEPPFKISPMFFNDLDLSQNRLSAEISEILVTNLTRARFISVANNKLFGEIPEIICDMLRLQVLDLSHNELNGTIPQCIGKLGSNLVILNLKHNKFHGKLPRSYEKECNLRTLNLNGNLLEGDIPRSLENCTELVVLDLGNNRMSDIFPFWLHSLSILRVLILRSNKFYGGIFTNINCSFPSLQIIDISSNNFIGTISLNCLKSLKIPSTNDTQTKIIATSMGDTYYRDSVSLVTKGQEIVIEKILYVFTSVDLSNNSFRGEIPEDIGELKSLRLLNISRNFLIGPIPPSIGNLTLLEALDLSINSLSGHIPVELASLTFLATLNLSINNFEGRIPQGTQFSTFDASFLGNPRLCGQPLPIKCPENSPSYMSLGKGSSDSFTETIWFTFSFGLVSGLIIGILVGNIVPNKRSKVHVSRR